MLLEKRRVRERQRGKFFGIPLLFFINIPEVGVDGQRLSWEGRITHTHTHTEGPEALGVGNITHTQCNPDTPLSIRSIDYTGRDKTFQRVLSPLSLLLTISSLIIWHVRVVFETVWGKYKWRQRTRATSIYQETPEQRAIQRWVEILSVYVQCWSWGSELGNTRTVSSQSWKCVSRYFSGFFLHKGIK